MALLRISGIVCLILPSFGRLISGLLDLMGQLYFLLLSKKMPMKNHEYIAVFCENEAPYNIQYRVKPLHQVRKSAKKVASTNYGAYNEEAERSIPIELGYPLSVIDFNTAYHGREGSLHPNQKGLDLWEYLIRTYTDEGMLVLDNTAGVFTTTIAAINTNRRSICIEKDPNYYRLGIERIKKHVAERQGQNGAQEDPNHRADQAS
jgi:site-specific DNA-methyltransferase (adenine-specific)